MFGVHVDGAFYLSRAVLPAMIRKKAGKIIQISSMWGISGGSCEVAYSSAKAALIGFTKALAKEVGPSGITVNCVAPGVINTPMNAHLSEDDLAVLAEETPLCRIGTPAEVANAVAFFAGPSPSPEVNFARSPRLSSSARIVAANWRLVAANDFLSSSKSKFFAFALAEKDFNPT
mgnify:CR=1 FL=1